jgi:serine/threonine-protein kinase Stk1
MNSAEGLPQLEGRVVNGRFRLLRWLGGSRVSDVFLTAIEGDPSRKAVLKLVAATTPDAEGRLAGWTAAARLSHPNLIDTIDCGRSEIDGCQFVYVVMDYADEVLAEILPVRPLTADETQEMLRSVLKALMYLHAQGYVHGRLKPSNILVVNDQLKLSGDCIGLAAGNRAARAETGGYDAPELGRGAVSPAVDVWALGMTLVAALTQRPAPWERWIQEEPVIPAGIAEPFGQIAQACLRLDPARRCTLDQLRAILDPGPAPLVASRSPEETRPREQTKRPGSRKAALVAGVAVLVVAGTALIVRKTEFPATGTRGGEQHTPASDSVSARPPQTATEKPSPSERSRNAAPETRASAGTVSVLPGAGNNGVLRRVIPDVLPAAQQSIRGHVDVGVRVTVDAAGNVTDAVLESPSRSNYFNRVAVDAARQWKFAAGPAGTWTVQFEFRQDGIDAGATRE